MNTDIRVLEAEPFFTRETPRMPIKFGGVVMGETVLCHVRVLAENRCNQRAEGWGAIFLADFWAWPSKRVPQESRERVMQDMVVECCSRIEKSHPPAHPIELFLNIEPELVPLAEELSRRHGLPEPMPRLAAMVCASPLDAALHDAFGKAAGIDSYEGYGPEHIDHDLSAWLGQEFRGRYMSDFLVPMPAEIDAFHLVGGLDKLTEGEITPYDPDDGLPVSLDQWIRREGLCCLKIKLRGNDMAWDLERFLGVVAVAREEHRKLGIDGLWLTADSNEMCESPEYMVELLRKLEDRYSRAFDSLLYIEQPCERDLQRRMLDVRELAGIKPVIVDEALSSMEDFNLAVELGYSGAALKTCKCQSAELLIAAKAGSLGLALSVQDLANPGIALLQSVGLAGHLRTIRGVESNSRQFFPNSNKPEQALHPGVYKLTGGRIQTHTIRGPGLGFCWDKTNREQTLLRSD
ncbi:MAG: mandelate racemase/muconate lactonizing enzyme family protein [Pirellulales bacterium]|nr:mandelate racemase/muconate lactonizing enzyme family protein [Pirellulales bacterium]